MKIFHLSTQKLCLSIILGAGLAATGPLTFAQGTDTQGTDTQGKSGTSMEQGEVEQGGNIKKVPSFQEADKNGDHYVTKDELQDYPFLLKHFDSVDAGSTGKLEEHEYANLVAEKRRERGR